MAQNAVLALCVARRLGVGPEELRSRLAAWQPARLRGEVRRTADQLLYLDCYNANPASMADALAAFAEIAPSDLPRLYVLGCMEELGPEAPALHHALGRHLQLRSGDQVFVIGTHAADVCAGLLEQGDVADQLRMVSTLEPAAAAVAGWRGAVFVKGSRRYQLEKVLEVQTNLPLPC
jgi:UDP-N-acetylmuramoyl-tripeptide--D-alanyl-D-alanine ligase